MRDPNQDIMACVYAIADGGMKCSMGEVKAQAMNSSPAANANFDRDKPNVAQEQVADLQQQAKPTTSLASGFQFTAP